MSKTREETEKLALEIYDAVEHGQMSRAVAFIQQARRDGAREELMYLKEQYGLTWFTTDERLSAVEQPTTKEKQKALKRCVSCGNEWDADTFMAVCDVCRGKVFQDHVL